MKQEISYRRQCFSLTLYSNIDTNQGCEDMTDDSVYKYIELTGVSVKSWEDAMGNAIALASKNLRDLRVAEVIQQDVRIEDNKIADYRVRLKLSFKYEKE